jgi:hypothetical protein
MSKAPAQKSAPMAAAGDHAIRESSSSFPRLPAAELLSFLKESGGSQSWTEKDFSKSLQIGLAQAREAIAVLQLQGYIEPAGRTGK